jgi:hypothetical protein
LVVNTQRFPITRVPVDDIKQYQNSYSLIIFD